MKIYTAVHYKSTQCFFYSKSIEEALIDPSQEIGKHSIFQLVILFALYQEIINLQFAKTISFL